MGLGQVGLSPLVTVHPGYDALERRTHPLVIGPGRGQMCSVGLVPAELNDPSQLKKLFKRAYGCSMNDWRKKHSAVSFTARR